jgi:hypothetical protein
MGGEIMPGGANGGKGLKIYLASRYTRREEMLGCAAELEAMGHEVTARWIRGNHQISDQGLSEEACAEERQRFAVEDAEDLFAAQCVVSFTEPPRSPFSRGGRHVEFGMGVTSGKKSIVVGHRENVFHCLPFIEFYPTWDEAKAALWEVSPKHAAEVIRAEEAALAEKGA